MMDHSRKFATEVVEQLYSQPCLRKTLANGLLSLHYPDFSSDVISMQVWVKAGSIHEGLHLGSGLSHFLEHMLFKGTSLREGKAIAREVQELGGQINAYTTYDRTVYYIDAPASAFDQVAEILADLIFNSTLPEAELEKERDVILREIDMGLDDPDRLLHQALFCTAFKQHPYREPVIGHRSLFKKVTRETLWDYYKTHYVPNNMVICLAGAIESSECDAVIETYFGKAERQCLPPSIIQSEPMQLAARRNDLVGDYNVFRGTVSFSVPRLSHPDSPALDALANALGGGESSYLWRRLRNEAKLVQHIDCRNWNPSDCGLFSINYICDLGQEEKVESAIFEALRVVIEEGFTAEDLEKSQRQALSAEINARKTMSGQASKLGIGEVVIGESQYMQRYLSRLYDLKVDDLQEVAARYCIRDGSSIVTLGPLKTGEASTALMESFPKAVPELIQTESGAQLILQRDAKLPKVHLRVIFLGGAMYELETQRGSTKLLAEMLTKDTASDTAAAIATRIEALGGSFYANAGNNTLSLALEVLPKDLPLALNILRNALTQPLFDATTFETERSAQIAYALEEADDILSFGFKRLRGLFFEDHPFSIGALGRKEDLDALKPDDLRLLFQKLVTPENCVLSVCGDFERETIISELLPLLDKDIGQSSFLKDSTPAFERTVSLEKYEVLEREQAVVLMGFAGVGVHDEDLVVSELLCELLNGLSSRLFERVREERGLAYYVGAARTIGLNTGMFTLYAGTQPGKTNAVVTEMEKEISRIANGEVDKSELVRCRTCLKAARPMGRQTIGARAIHAAVNLTYDMPIDDDVDHNEKLDACTAEVLAKFAKKYLDLNKRVLLVVGPKVPVTNE
jgi:zinc protease